MPRLRQIRRRYGGGQQAEPEYDESDPEGARAGGAPGSDENRQSQDRIGAILGTEKGIAYEETEVDGMSCEWVKVERAHLKRYVILYCHGGGYSTGSTVYAETLTTKLAESTGMDVFCFNYRLAPECKFPAAAEDAMKAWNYLMYLGYGARDVIVAGDSAGGNLALSLTLKLKEEGRMLPRGLALMSPWTDLTKSGKSYQTRSSVDPVLDHEYLDRMIENYAGGMELTNPYISPLFESWKGCRLYTFRSEITSFAFRIRRSCTKISSRQMFLPESTFIRACGMCSRCRPSRTPMTR